MVLKAIMSAGARVRLRVESARAPRLYSPRRAPARYRVRPRPTAPNRAQHGGARATSGEYALRERVEFMKTHEIYIKPYWSRFRRGYLAETSAMTVVNPPSYRTAAPCSAGSQGAGWLLI